MQSSGQNFIFIPRDVDVKSRMTTLVTTSYSRNKTIPLRLYSRNDVRHRRWNTDSVFREAQRAVSDVKKKIVRKTNTEKVDTEPDIRQIHISRAFINQHYL